MIPRDDIGPVTAIPGMGQPLCTIMANILICGAHMHRSLYQIKDFIFVEIELVCQIKYLIFNTLSVFGY